MTKRADIFFLTVIVFTWFAVSCTQQRSPCYEPKIVSVSLGTYQLAGDTVEVDSMLTDPAFYCIDTLLVQTITSNNKFAALLSPFADSTRWVMVPNLEDTTGGKIPSDIAEYDTITFYHTKDLNFISNACGYAFYYKLTDIKTTYNSIDSILISNNSVDNNASTQHVKIYY